MPSSRNVLHAMGDWLERYKKCVVACNWKVITVSAVAAALYILLTAVAYYTVLWIKTGYTDSTQFNAGFWVLAFSMALQQAGMAALLMPLVMNA